MPTADLIVTNARVLTVDPARPRAEAVAVAGDTILAVGDRAEVMATKGPGTRVIDAAGGSVTPGFVEAHLHIFAGAAELDQCQLHGVEGAEAFRAKVAAYAAGRPGEPLIVGQGAGYTMFSESAPITRHDLDAAVPDRPFLMFAADHHTAWANTAALEHAGILRGRAVGVGNEIVMGADGLATGELREREAFGPVVALSTSGGRERSGLDGSDPDATAAERAYDRKVLQRGLDHLARHGITSFHNMDGNRYLASLLGEMEAAGELTCRARVPFHFLNFMDLDALDTASELAARHRSERLSCGFVKMFMDGVLESWTAVMAEDYADRPGWRGEPLFERRRFAEIATEIDRRGLQIAVHAIGDGAVNTVLDGYAAARGANGPRDSRHRVEHVEVALPTDIPRFSELGVLASMQPPHPPGTGFPLEPTVSRIGRARWPHAYAWNTLRDADARLVFASDWPVSPVDPMEGIGFAMTRKPWAPGLPDQRQSLDQALAGYTADGAYAEFMEHRKGRLKPGMLADLVVFGGDIEAAEPEAIAAIRPAVTICGGATTFEA